MTGMAWMGLMGGVAAAWALADPWYLLAGVVALLAHDLRR